MTTESDCIKSLVNRLRERYRRFPLEPFIWERDGQKRSPYRVLIVMGTSPGVRDSVGIPIWEKFLGKYPSPDILKQGWQTDKDGVLKNLHSLGKHEHSEKIIKAAVKMGSDIPSDVSKLKKHDGIGPAIAEKIRGYGFGEPALPLDSNGHNIIAGECGSNDSIERLRKKLKNIFDPSKWMEVHELLRLHGQSRNSTPEIVIELWEKWRALLVED